MEPRKSDLAGIAEESDMDVENVPLRHRPTEGGIPEPRGLLSHRPTDHEARQSLHDAAPPAPADVPLRHRPTDDEAWEWGEEGEEEDVADAAPPACPTPQPATPLQKDEAEEDIERIRRFLLALHRWENPIWSGIAVGCILALTLALYLEAIATVLFAWLVTAAVVTLTAHLLDIGGLRDGERMFTDLRRMLIVPVAADAWAELGAKWGRRVGWGLAWVVQWWNNALTLRAPLWTAAAMTVLWVFRFWIPPLVPILTLGSLGWLAWHPAWTQWQEWQKHKNQ